MRIAPCLGSTGRAGAGRGVDELAVIHRHRFKYFQYFSTILRSCIEFQPKQPDSLERGRMRIAGARIKQK